MTSSCMSMYISWLDDRKGSGCRISNYGSFYFNTKEIEQNTVVIISIMSVIATEIIKIKAYLIYE